MSDESNTSGYSASVREDTNLQTAEGDKPENQQRRGMRSRALATLTTASQPELQGRTTPARPPGGSAEAGEIDEEKGSAATAAPGPRFGEGRHALLDNQRPDASASRLAEGDAHEEQTDNEDKAMLSLLLLAAGKTYDGPDDDDDRDDVRPQEATTSSGRGRGGRRTAANGRTRTPSERRAPSRFDGSPQRAADGKSAAPMRRGNGKAAGRSGEVTLTSTSVIQDPPPNADILNAVQALFPQLLDNSCFASNGLLGAHTGWHLGMLGSALGGLPVATGRQGGAAHPPLMEHESLSNIEELARQRAAVIAAEKLEAQALADQQLTSHFLSQLLSQRQQANHRSGSDLLQGYLSRGVSTSGASPEGSFHGLSGPGFPGAFFGGSLSPVGLASAVISQHLMQQQTAAALAQQLGSSLVERVQQEVARRGGKRKSAHPARPPPEPRQRQRAHEAPDPARRRKRPGPVSCRDKIWALFSEEEQASMVSDALSAAEGAKLLLQRRVKQLGVGSIAELPEDDDWGIDYKLTECKATSEPLEKPKNCSICQRENAVFHRHSYYCRRCAQLYRAVHRKKSALQVSSNAQAARAADGDDSDEARAG